MSTPALLAIFWVFVATGTALLPMRYQPWPGIPLLIAAPVLIVWLGAVHGWWISGLALAAFLSMFRRPLFYLIAKLRGQNPERPQ